MPDTSTAPRKIEYLPLDLLKPNPRNPKAHDLETIDDSVGRFGYVEPIVRDDRTGFIVSGHGRTKTLKAMHERGESPPEGILVDEKGRWLVPVGVGWSSRTDTEAAAALIALNRTTELGGWVDESLLELLDELSEAEDGYLGVGFSEKDRDDLARLLDSLGDGGDLDEVEDWDGESGLTPARERRSIEVTSDEAWAGWVQWRGGFEDDVSALLTLLSQAGAL